MIRLIMLLLLIFGFILSVLLTAMSISLRSLSTQHLRYWARKGDDVSKKLYPLKARGSAVLLTIELFRALAISGTLIALAGSMWGVFAWLIGTVTLFIVFVVLGELYLKSLGMRLLVWSARGLLATSQALKFIMLPLGRALDTFIAKQPVITSRSELTHMFNAILPGDTDLSEDELRILKHALVFGEKSVYDVMTPRSVVVSVKEDDVLSPILLDDLHKSGHSRFPVLATAADHATGILYTKDLHDLKHNAAVKDLMHTPVHYVNENRELDHVLQAFIKTKQHMFLVVNEFAEITGLVTIEDIVEQILGKPIIDEFDRYDNMRDVANAKAKIVRKKIKMIE